LISPFSLIAGNETHNTRAITVRAIKFYPNSHSEPKFFETDVSIPVPGPHDILVHVEAVSINPVDTKVRAGRVQVPVTVDVLGWDAAGTVVAVGAEAHIFKPGDEVYYSGTITRPGSLKSPVLTKFRVGASLGRVNLAKSPFSGTSPL
jgi:NADPH:quinone reductase-like Zn-dependent oxidoreductase